ncbi:MAG: hypothetical protein VX614_06845 [Myxococcota bacterium]|nr:hypothetical protein [Myxococcota bacterium]
MPMIHSDPEYVEVTPELKEKFERFRQEHANDPVGDVAQVVLYEDDDVRVWEMKLEPGEASDLHTHEHEYVLVVMSGDVVAGITPKGHPVDPFIGKIPEQGNTVRVPKGNTEWAVNIGKKTYHEVLIELKHT